MSFQTPITIAEAIENIDQGQYLLPAIQREFVWSHYKIEWLFDSLMRGYPISSFLFWSVERESVSDYKFYRFLRSYRERYNVHNEDADVAGMSNFTAVLDGQQRLTSLYIGLKGSFAYKMKYRKWADDEWSVPTRHLYLNISETLDEKDEEDGRVYEFSFLEQSKSQKEDIHCEKWFRVGKILDLRNTADLINYLNENNFGDTAKNILARLHEVVFTERFVNYYLEKEQDLHKALNIFIRINSGGQPLDFSDLIMSVAIANWERKDARKEIHGLVDRIKDAGFSIAKDFVFKVYLYLFSADIGFKVTNFTRANAHSFENDWEGIRDAIVSAFKLAKSYGYMNSTLVSKNALLPIIYYIYYRGIYHEFSTRVGHENDRRLIQQWLHIMTLKRVFGGQSDTTLSQIRRAFTDDVTGPDKITSGLDLFPADSISDKIRRDISVGDEFIDDLLSTPKHDRYAFCILALLYPHLDYKNNDFHMDHLHPASVFNKNKAEELGLTSDDSARFLDKALWNSITNLQMLGSNENESKQDTPLEQWVASKATGQELNEFLGARLIPADTDLGIHNFLGFFEARKDLLRSRLKDLLQ